MLIFSNKRLHVIYKVTAACGVMVCGFIVLFFFTGGLPFTDAWQLLALFGFLGLMPYLGYRYTSSEVRLGEIHMEIINPVTKDQLQIPYTDINKVELSDLTSKVYIKLKNGKSVCLGPNIERVSGEFLVPVPGPAAVASIGPRLKDEIESRIRKATT